MYSASYYRTCEAPALNRGELNADPRNWFAIYTHPRHEKAVAHAATEKGITTFLPLVRQIRQWSDRRKVVDLPLFSGYLFVKVAPQVENRLDVLRRVNGVLGFVGSHGQGVPIPEEQIDTVRLLVEEGLPLCSHPFLKIGQRIRVRNGALSGIEGILVSRSGEQTLIISLDAIQRSMSLRIEGYDVEPA